jgi:hypothetical protein
MPNRHLKGKERITAMVKKRQVGDRVTAGGGNVFADLGFPQPERELAKAQLVVHMRQLITERIRATKKKKALLRGLGHYLTDELKDPEFAVEYARAALRDGDQEDFARAVRDVMRACSKTGI